MSDEAFNLFQQALGEQHQRNEARHIRTRVHEARQTPHLAGMRWPFELLQNALDAGPREGQEVVTAVLRHENEQAAFEHDGAPFSSSELAALLSGGSSKDFGSEETTGRFGTGFLVTHVLAERMSLEGLLSVETGYERFSVVLDRSGDEESILENIRLCNNAIRKAEKVESLEGVPSARFEYPISDGSVLDLGVDAFRVSLPFLYGTRRQLGKVEFHDKANGIEIWLPEDPIYKKLDEGFIEDRAIYVDQGSKTRNYRILRFTSRENSLASALVLLLLVDNSWEVFDLPDASPRIFRQYPLRGSIFVPIRFVFDGKFEPDQERSRVLMNPSDKEALSHAFEAAAIAMSYAFTEGWRNAHLLARTFPSASAFDPDDLEEKEWWQNHLSQFACRLADLPIVYTTDGFLPAATSFDRYADFIVPRLSQTSTIDETTVERLWPLVNRATDLDPPIQDLSLDWSKTTEGWSALKVPLNRVTVESLGRYVRNDVDNIRDLHVNGEPHEWLASFIDVVGECWKARGGIDKEVLEGLLPNQKGELCSPDDLRRDAGVPEELKIICEAVGLDLRTELLSEELSKCAAEDGFQYADEALEKTLPRMATAGDVEEELLNYLRSLLTEDVECSEDNADLQRGTMLFLDYLWRTTGEEGAGIARKIPLVNCRHRVVYWSSERMLMAPVAVWHEDARPFHGAYPPNRILDDLYGSAETNVVTALSAWGMVIPDPITTSHAAELKERRLAAMVEIGYESDGVVVKGEKFSQIALLQPEVLNRCQEGVEEARALLGLVLCHVSRHDPTWREFRTVMGRKGRVDINVTLRGALWIGDLRSRAWVPVPGEDDRPAKAAADSMTLRSLLAPSWLVDNDDAIALLTQCFGFDELDLRLLGIAPEAQDQVRQGLARLLESGGANPDLYKSLAEELEARKRRSRDVDRYRRIGIAVQEAVREVLESYGLAVKLVDRGFDYAVSLQTDEMIEDAVIGFEVGPYLVEVKATTRGPVRLTPMQAETAAARTGRYVLCVVDLRDIHEERLDADWIGADVEPLASMVSNIGSRVHDTCVLVNRARTSDVGIRNESALRYEVPVNVWDSGTSIATWVATVSNEQDVWDG